MSAKKEVILDACVLVNAALRDTLLRLAESPQLYLPRWSDNIIHETTRTLENKLGLTSEQTSHLVEQLKMHFPEAWVEDYEALIPGMHNHAKDRHVLAAAVRCRAEVIVTFNVKDFPSSALSPWDLDAQTPDEFLTELLFIDPSAVLARLSEQAVPHGGLERLLAIHEKTAPRFTALLREEFRHSQP